MSDKKNEGSEKPEEDPMEILKRITEDLGKNPQEFLDNFPAAKNMEAGKQYGYEAMKQHFNNEEAEEMYDMEAKPLQVSFYNASEELPDPKYEYDADSGFDLRNNQDDISLEPLERKIVPTGLYVSLQDGVELQIRPKSGLAAKKGLTVLNAPGTIDSNYRGEICVILVNLSNETVDIEYGDKIAQAVISTVSTGKFIDLNGIDKDEFFKEETERGSGAFGSTGDK